MEQKTHILLLTCCPVTHTTTTAASSKQTNKEKEEEEEAKNNSSNSNQNSDECECLCVCDEMNAKKGLLVRASMPKSGATPSNGEWQLNANRPTGDPLTAVVVAMMTTGRHSVPVWLWL